MELIDYYFINGPTTDFSEDDADKVIDYINQGGKVAMEKTIDDDTVAKVVVAGSAEMFADSADQIVSGNNSKVYLTTTSLADTFSKTIEELTD